MGLKIKNVNIKEVQQFLAEGGHKETIYMGYCLKREAWPICREICKNRVEGVAVFLAGWGVDTSMHTELILVGLN